MRLPVLGLIALFTACCASALAQSSSPSLQVNQIDNLSGDSYSFPPPIPGDFNNDGNTDFVFVAYTPNGDQVLQTALGRGNGMITSIAPTPLPAAMTFRNYGSSNFPGAAISDFNGDGKQDLVLVTSVDEGMTNSLSTFVGKGDGTFGAPTNLPIPNGEVPIQIATADFNHDGKADLVALCQSGDVLVYLGNGNGSFQNPVTSNAGVQNRAYFQVGDINKDGFPDLLVWADNSSFSASILQGNGDGSFKSPVAIPQIVAQNGGGQQMYLLADVNGDGNLDILADLNDGSLVLYFAGDGKGDFANAVTSVTLPSNFMDQSQFSVPPALLDLNGDGKLDLVFSSLNSQPGTLWAQGNGDGTFQTPTQLTTANMQGVYPVHLNAHAVALYSPLVQSQNDYASAALFLPTTLPQVFEISQGAVQFGTVDIGSASSGGQSCLDSNSGFCPNADITITNRGTAALDLSSIATQNPFSQLNDCPSSLPAAQHCRVSAEFAPQQVGLQAGILAIGNGTSLNPFQVALVGTGATPTFSLSPSSLSFAAQKIGTLSAPQTITLTNLTGTPQDLSNLLLISVNQNEFIENDNCPYNLATSCTISIQFAPTLVGAKTANLQAWSANGDVATASIAGSAFSIGPALSVSPSSLDFGTPFVGTNVTPQSVTLTNTGDVPVTISSVAAGTGFTTLNACGNSIQPGASCAIGVFIDTSSTGTKTASLTITDSAPDSPQKVSLTGTVQTLTVTASSGSSTSATISSGGSATYMLTITPQSGFRGTITVGCTNAPAGYSCTPSPTTLTSNGSSPLNVTFTVKANTTAASEPARGPFSRLPIALGLPLLFFLFPKSMRSRFLWMVVLVATVVPFTVGCGGSGGGSSASGTNSTPTNYTLTATFTAADGGTVQVPLKLTVQN